MKIVTKKAEGGATLSFFPASRVAVTALREAFGTEVSYRPDEKAWFLAGDTARSRLFEWGRDNKESVEASVKAVREAPKAEMDAMTASDINDAMALADASPILSGLVVRSDDLTEWLVKTPYHPEIVEAMREGVLGSRFDRSIGSWRVPLTSTEPLRAEMPGIEKAAKAALAADVPKPATRWLGLVADLPAIGEPMDRDDAIVVPVTVGKSFKANKSTLRDHAHLDGHLGEDVAYVYYREATPDETEAFEAAHNAPTP